ncbi:hypothetical protein NDK47_24490 [Brevibacillus ruminantium]|uniref:Zinc-finger domain-containing protein n=1 Tax=Brevibacillus ruminantium TaxID=2950604 RepID=A0ABY4WDU8_9BACL|nr:hypothetical protein [Brevibacillus ruminantium]USG65242.1 hypothetical protein NDK47_24490 [Brevibacillus ruminantium]
MPHIDEFTLMMYCDGELSETEAYTVQEHVSTCCLCRKAMEQQMAEGSLVAEHFFAGDLPPLSFELHPLTKAQIKGIARLHKQKHRRFTWRIILFAGSIIALVTGYLLFWQRIWVEWALPALTTWRTQLFWSSALWINDNARDLLNAPGAYLIALPLPFLVLIGLLLVLNIRFSPLSHTSITKREVD